MKSFDENRRKIMSLIGAGTIGAVATQLMPFKVFAKKSIAKTELKDENQELTVKLHPLAVHRNKKG